MKKPLLFGMIFLAFSACIGERETFMISGKATDFNGQPIDSVIIRLKNRAFENIYETLTDENGNYAIKVNKGVYYCLFAIKLSEYRVNRLEYWAWNVPVYKNMTINPQYDRIEIYGMNAFEPQVTPQKTYMLYFRPMSLSKTLRVASEQEVDSEDFQNAKQAEKLLDNSNMLINISPERISADELTIEINGIKSEISGINRITEYARGFTMYGYCVQVLKPENNRNLKSAYDLISVTLHSKETGETGKGETFIKK